MRDVKEAYRTILIKPSQWPGIVVRLPGSDAFAVDTMDCFGLASGCGCYGIVGDAGSQIIRANGMGPLSKWVDDHIFFRIRREFLPMYNKSRERWAEDIRKEGGEKQVGGRCWFQGAKNFDDCFDEYDEDMLEPIKDLALSSPRAEEDLPFTYAIQDIDNISDELGIPWERGKDITFREVVPYIGFEWDLNRRQVSITAEKRQKYLQAITEWKDKCTHTLEETQKLYGKLLHVCLVIPAG